VDRREDDGQSGPEQEEGRERDTDTAEGHVGLNCKVSEGKVGSNSQERSERVAYFMLLEGGTRLSLRGRFGMICLVSSE
jgi:hypothetical protein